MICVINYEKRENIYLNVLLSISGIYQLFTRSCARFSDEIRRCNTIRPGQLQKKYASWEFDLEYAESFSFAIINFRHMVITLCSHRKQNTYKH